MSNRNAGTTSSQQDRTPEIVPLRAKVEERAYYRYLERGRTDGLALDDWLAAETELHLRPENRSE